ncbi:hypothetical protein SpCBS45565_g02593 [Spizellomyces sp. 'palustris']|nr:hypothetical protein SpCBS45565_g02593 [Spizellomyces sp. 'palustris']
MAVYLTVAVLTVIMTAAANQEVSTSSADRSNSNASTQALARGATNRLPLFVRHLPVDEILTAEEVYTFFSDFGKVGTVTLHKHRERPERPSGTAVVYLEEPKKEIENMLITQKKIDLLFRGRQVEVRLDRRHSLEEHITRRRRIKLNPGYPDDCLKADRLALGAFISLDRYCEKWVQTQDVKLIFEYAGTSLGQTLASVIFKRNNVEYKLEYKFKNIRDTFKLDCRSDGNRVHYDLVASLSLPPRVSFRQNDRFSVSSSRSHGWVRIAFSSIAGNELPSDVFFWGYEKRIGVISGVPDTGRFMDHRYTFTYERVDGQRDPEEDHFLAVLEHLAQFGLVVDRQRYSSIEFVSLEDAPPRCNVLEAPLNPYVKFKLLGLVSHSNISDRVYFRTDDATETADMESEASVQGDTARIVHKIQHNEKLNYNQRMVRKVIITPTKMYYLGPQLELANRILRTYKAYNNQFMRVTFCDDDFTQMSGPHTDLLFNRIEAIFAAGITVAGKTFQFLHYSNSSMKTSGCWFISPFFYDEKRALIDANYVYKTMGDFTGIKNPATLGARMAQCFSSTTVTGKMADERIGYIPDIERNGFCFSDGVGRIGKTVAFNNCGELKKSVVIFQIGSLMTVIDMGPIVSRYMRVRGRLPSAFQFRMAGAKGGGHTSIRAAPQERWLHKFPLFIQSLQSTATYQGTRYIFGQAKFKSGHYALEVCRTSFYSPGYLNHQYVILLETLGIHKQVFLDLRDETIRDLDRALQNPVDAIKVLSENQDEEGVCHTLITMITAGFFEAKEPYLMNLLKLFRTLQLRELKRRAKILVKRGCTLIGVMDESGILPAGNLFVQFTNPVTDTREIVKGRAAIMRAPCLHPGDVQVVDCVDIPQLHHLVDVVVFSQHGERPLPDMLSGGDLDGDTFFVTWDARLIPKKADNPMEYAIGTPAHPQGSHVAQIRRHFINYLKHNNLGQIDNAWKAWADISESGARDPHALRLAELHSDAVDFAKKGIPAIMESALRPKKWPDFMEKPEIKSYRSEKAAGEIYRSVSVDLELLKEFQPLPQLIISGYERYLKEARDQKMQYDTEICALMNQYGIKSEFELVSGYIFKLSELELKKRPQELKEQVMHAVLVIQRGYRERFWTQDLMPNEDKSLLINKESVIGFETPLPKEICCKASAWYMAAYNPTQPEAHRDDSCEKNEETLAAERRRRAIKKSDAEYERIDWDMHGQFYSFPWILYDVLSNLYRQSCPAKEDHLDGWEYAQQTFDSTWRSGKHKHGTFDEATERILKPAGYDTLWS